MMVAGHEGYWFCPAGMCYHLKGAWQTSMENDRVFTLPPCPRCTVGNEIAQTQDSEPQVFYTNTYGQYRSRYYHLAPTCPNDGPLVRKRNFLNCKAVRTQSMWMFGLSLDPNWTSPEVVVWR